MKYVYQKGNSLYYVKRRNGKLKWTRLCDVDAPAEELNAAVNRIKWRGRNTLKDVFEDYQRYGVPELALATQMDYVRILENVLTPVFGHMRPDDLTSQDVAMYLEKRKREGRSSSGNKERAVLSSAFNHAMRIGQARINPCYGVRRNKETPRDRYVDDDSLRLALRHSGPGLRHLMWAAYLTGYRQHDLINLTRENITPDGILVKQSKGGKRVLIMWSESLRKVVRRAVARSKCPYIFTNDHGQKISREGIKSSMRRMKDKIGADWTFHDLRAKAESDHKTGLGLMTRYKRATRLKAVR